MHALILLGGFSIQLSYNHRKNQFIIAGLAAPVDHFLSLYTKNYLTK